MTRKRIELMIKTQPTIVNWLEMRLRVREMPPTIPSLGPWLFLHPNLCTLLLCRERISTPTASLGPVCLPSPAHLPTSPLFFFPLPFSHFSISFFSLWRPSSPSPSCSVDKHDHLVVQPISQSIKTHGRCYLRAKIPTIRSRTS